IAPTRPLDQSEGGAAEGEDSALDLDLRELRVAGGDADVLGQAQLDAERQTAAVDGDDGRLGSLPAVHTPGIDAPGEVELALHEQRRNVHEIESGGEVLAVGEDDATADVGVALELAERIAERTQHVGVECVHL